MAIENPIVIVGGREFRKELKAVDVYFAKELRVAAKEAADIVANATRSSFSSRSGVAPKVATSVKTLAQQTGASVRIGGPKYPFALGAEFGGGKFVAGRPSPRGGYTDQFPPWRGNKADAGYSLFPSIRAKKDEVVDAYGDAIERLAAKAFPDRGGTGG